MAGPGANSWDRALHSAAPPTLAAIGIVTGASRSSADGRGEAVGGGKAAPEGDEAATAANPSISWRAASPVSALGGGSCGGCARTGAGGWGGDSATCGAKEAGAAGDVVCAADAGAGVRGVKHSAADAKPRSGPVSKCSIGRPAAADAATCGAHDDRGMELPSATPAPGTATTAVTWPTVSTVAGHAFPAARLLLLAGSALPPPNVAKHISRQATATPSKHPRDACAGIVGATCRQ
mmetsp:Transcript_7222/g.20489  ORF Transcript_7222/g.20489 Transcript_7222/m.20489 type:complete len:236 (-) Transcript_7222:66-773(-)